MGPDTKLLDVGCGSGKFLDKIRQETGCKVQGLDISRQAVKYANENYGIDVFCGNITEAPFAAESFDIITAWWYLEHIPNPSLVLQTMHRFLKTNGHCIIGIPNIESFNGKFFKDKWYHLDCPRHLFLYSPNTISSFLKKAGFDVEKIVYDKAARGLFHSCRYYFGKENVSLRNRGHIPGSSIIKKLMLPFTLFLSLIKKSDTMVIYAVKRKWLSYRPHLYHNDNCPARFQSQKSPRQQVRSKARRWYYIRLDNRHQPESRSCRHSCPALPV